MDNQNITRIESKRTHDSKRQKIRQIQKADQHHQAQDTSMNHQKT